MSGSFSLREIQNSLQIADAHFPVVHDQVQDPEPAGVRTGEENLRPQVNIEMF